MLADISVEHNNLEYIEKYATQAEELANRHDHRQYQAISHRALGVANRLKSEYKQAENRLTKALEIFEELDTTWQLGRTYYEFGQLYAAQDKPKEAKKHYEQAIKRYENMGAIPNIERTQAALKAIK
jgi:tetratricopeptide (TPR) repeat protein